jgi:hypothetical protein
MLCELDNAFVRRRHDELRRRVVGKPTGIADREVCETGDGSALMQPGLLMMRLRLSDAATSAVLAEHHRTQAMACQQMALITLSPFRDIWLELAAGWKKLAQEQEAEAKSH